MSLLFEFRCLKLFHDSRLNQSFNMETDEQHWDRWHDRVQNNEYPMDPIWFTTHDRILFARKKLPELIIVADTNLLYEARNADRLQALFCRQKPSLGKTEWDTNPSCKRLPPTYKIFIPAVVMQEMLRHLGELKMVIISR